MRTAAIRASGVGKRFRLRINRRSVLAAAQDLVAGVEQARELWVLRDLSVEIARGARVALVGGNGCGKTTLLRLIAGIYRPTRGRLEVRVEPRILFRSYVGFTPELPVVDNVFLFAAVHGIERQLARARLRAILEFGELESKALVPLKNLSVGQVRRLALSTFCESTGDLLILDEALDNIDAAFRSRVIDRFHRLLTPSRTLLMTSHDPELLQEFCEHGLWIEDGRIALYDRLEPVLSAYSRGTTGP